MIYAPENLAYPGFCKAYLIQILNALESDMCMFVSICFNLNWKIVPTQHVTNKSDDYTCLLFFVKLLDYKVREFIENESLSCPLKCLFIKD